MLPPNGDVMDAGYQGCGSESKGPTPQVSMWSVWEETSRHGRQFAVGLDHVSLGFQQ
jgi:hypothetical protein